MFQSIRYKLISISIVAIVVCAGLVFLFSINEHENLYQQSVKQNLEALTLNMADDLLLAMTDQKDDFAITNELLRFDRHKDVILANVFDAEWLLIQQYVHPEYLDHEEIKTSLTSIDESQRVFHVILSDEGLVAIKPIGEQISPVGYLLVVHEFQRPLEESREKLFLSAVPFVLLAILIATLGSIIISRRFLTPLINLSKFTKKIEKSADYQLQIEVVGNDEVSQLSHDINNMLNTIHSEHTTNRKHTEKLIEQQHSMQRLANYDILTGLPNRLFFMELLAIELARSKRNDCDLTIMFFDVDGFKGINDTLGHEVGDKLLQEVTKCIQGCLRDGDVLARLGGDEFLIMIPNVVDSKLGINIAKRITARLVQPFHINSWDVKTGVSIGIANAKDADFELDTFISNADIAMYSSKEKGKGTFTIFNKSMLEGKRRKDKIASLIGKAMLNNEFSIHYQLKISNSGQTDGLEALLRWTNDELGVISPDELIPIAEQGGLIQTITQWVIAKVFSDMPRLQEICSDDVVVSLNISSHDLQDQNFIHYIEQQLDEHSVDIKHIQLEMTESSYLENFEMANKFFNRIHDMKGSIALDDFGTGYSSLSYLTKIKIDTLKIDRSFVSHYDSSNKDTVILQTILELAQRLGLKTCSEGIETAGQAKYLLSQGCQHMQGFYFAKPVPMSELNNAIVEAIKQFKNLNL